MSSMKNKKKMEEIITMKNDADKMLNSNIEISRECDADNCMDCDYREM